MTVSLMQAVNGYPRVKRNKNHSTATGLWNYCCCLLLFKIGKDVEHYVLCAVNHTVLNSVCCLFTFMNVQLHVHTHTLVYDQCIMTSCQTLLKVCSQLWSFLSSCVSSFHFYIISSSYLLFLLLLLLLFLFLLLLLFLFFLLLLLLLLLLDVPLSTGDEDEEEEDDMNTRERASLPIG